VPDPAGFEPAARYRVELDFRDVNDSRTLALAYVQPGSRVLDLGIGDGTVGRTLKDMGCRTWGLEKDKALVDGSPESYEAVVHGDLEVLDLGLVFEGLTFDVVLCLDILEHTADPLRVLLGTKDVIGPTSRVVVSLPNVTHAAVKAQLLEGRFSYTEQGLLDATHLRFFDRSGMEGLFGDAGFVVLDQARVTRPIGGTEIPVDVEGLSDDVRSAIEADPESDTYQFVSLLAPNGSPLAESPPLLPLRILQEEVRRLQGHLGGRRDSGRYAADDLALQWMEEELGRLRQRSRDHRAAVWSLVAEFRNTIRELTEQIKAGS